MQLSKRLPQVKGMLPMPSFWPHLDRIHRGSRALLAGVFCCSLGLMSGCDSPDHNRFQPHPPRERPGNNKAGETTTNTAITDNSVAAVPTGSLPTVVNLDGQEHQLTPPGARLTFGEPATVASIDSEGRMLLWTVTPYNEAPLPPEEVELLDPATATNVAHYTCYTFDIEFLGVVPAHTNHPLILNGFADTVLTPVAAPNITLGNSDGSADVRKVLGGTDNSCGIPKASRLPTNESNLALGVTYTRGLIGVIDQNIRPEQHPSSVIYRFDYKIPGVADSPTPPAPIMWTYGQPSSEPAPEEPGDPVPE